MPKINNVRFESSSSLKKIQNKTALHLQCCQVCWHMLASKLEGNKHVLHMDRSTACLLATLSHGSLRNITLSEVFSIHSQQRVANIRCIGCIGLGPIGCTWMHMDGQRILAMRHLVSTVPLSSCYGINRTRSTMTGSNKQRVYIYIHLYYILKIILYI